MIAQDLGAGRFAAAQRGTIIALRASSILGVVIMLVVAVGAPFFVRGVRAPEEIMGDATAYLWLAAAGLAFNAYIVAATAVLRAYGRTVALLVIGVVVNLLDIALLYLFLIVLDLGVVAAALPTLLVRGAAVLLGAWLIRQRVGVGVLSTRVPE